MGRNVTVLLCRLGNILSLVVFGFRGKVLLSVGASTSICSVIGFDLTCRVLQRSVVPIQMRRIGITLLTILLISLIPGVDFWGHFGSLLAGFLLALAFLDTSQVITNRKKRKWLKWGGLGLLLGYSVGLIWLLINN